MSTPEAKQAAEWRLIGSGFTCILVDENNRTIATNLEEGSGRFICDAHNAATAKSKTRCGELREELEQVEFYVRELRVCIRDLVLNSQDGVRDHTLEIQGVELAAKPVQLAHQQPSATTPDVEIIIGRKLCPYEERIFRTEGMAEELGYEVIGRYISVAALAQSREPLVKDKERLDWMDRNDSLDVIDFFVNEAEPIRAAIDKAMRHAALTGTEEKR